ncbi:MAG: hypothetical protein Q7T57_04680 [Dehalococcoidales bacterium]|nr:hypothetical protein [Dehalococcoidales bacterium]
MSSSSNATTVVTKKRKVRDSTPHDQPQLLTRAEMEAALVRRDSQRLLLACITAQHRCIQHRVHRPVRIPVGHADAASIEEVTKRMCASGFQARYDSVTAALEIDFTPVAKAADSDQDGDQE